MMVGVRKWNEFIAIIAIFLTIGAAAHIARPSNEHVSEAVGAFLKYHAEEEFLSKRHAEIGNDPFQFCVFGDYDFDLQVLERAVSESHAVIFDGDLCDRDIEQQDGSVWSFTKSPTGSHAWEVEIVHLNCASIRSCELMIGDCSGERTYQIDKSRDVWQVTDVSSIVIRCLH
ncbi:MAG: hypothetical protein AAFY19_06835 [Pseudomonadota bacterium]